MTTEKAKAWFLLFRPWSYTATIIPFAVAFACLAVSSGDDDCGSGMESFSISRLLLALAAALPLQAVVNLMNTWGDERSGVDDVPGAIRTTPQVKQGLVSMNGVLGAAIACFCISGLLALPLFFYTAGENGVNLDISVTLSAMFDFACGRTHALYVNWGLIAVAIIGALGATNYSTGIKFKYRGLGVPFVFFLMGSIEVLGFLCASFSITGSFADPSNDNLIVNIAEGVSLQFLFAFVVAFPISCLVAVIMHGNDMRDIPTDRAAGIKTTASILGPKGALILFVLLHAVPYLAVALSSAFSLILIAAGADRISAAAMAGLALGSIAPFLALPLSLKTISTAIRVYRDNPVNPSWRGLERRSGLVHFVFGLLYSVSLFAIMLVLFLVSVG